MKTKTGTFNLRGSCLIALVVFLVAGGSQGYARQRRAVGLAGISPSLPLSPGIVTGNTLYVAGLQGTDRNGKVVGGGIDSQTRATMENIRKVVKAAGFQMKDVVAVNVYLTDMHNFSSMNKIYATFFPNPKPTRTTVQVAALSNGAEIEISAIAVRRGIATAHN